MSALITGQLANVPEKTPVKYLTYGVWFNHWTLTKYTSNQLSEISNAYSVLIIHR